jgi:hypothetical protein
MRKLRIPVAVAFVLMGCGGDDGDGEMCSISREPCVQAPNDLDNVCPTNTCVDSQNQCPVGCIRASAKRYCVPDGTDAGCPMPTICITDTQTCPPGCNPVG